MSILFQKPLIIRTDAGEKIGNGHVMRCMALAQTWKDAGGEVLFIMASGYKACRSTIESEGIEILHLSTLPGSRNDVLQTVDIAKTNSAEWIVVDGYHFTSDYQKSIKNNGIKSLFIDDCGSADVYHGDIILNQNLHADKSLYVNKAPETRLLLGSAYVLLRKEFTSLQNRHKKISAKSYKIIVTMGGSDPQNITLRVIQALIKINAPLDVKIIVGSSNPHMDIIQHSIRSAPFSMYIQQNAKNMADLMAWADLAISAGGSTLWEMAFMGLPAITISTAENQRNVAQKLHDMGTVSYIGWYDNLTELKISKEIKRLIYSRKNRAKMSVLGKKIIDGKGVEKVIREITSLKPELREVLEKDCEAIWQWVNDPETRSLSFSLASISWEDHQKWFKSKLNDTSCCFYIAQSNSGMPLGVVRFDIKGIRATVSVNIAPAFRGKGYGSKVIALGSKKIMHDRCISYLDAMVRPENKASFRAFQKAGYKKKGFAEILEKRSIHLIYQKDSNEKKPIYKNQKSYHRPREASLHYS